MPLVLIEKADEYISYVTLNRPEKLNPLSDDMFLELQNAIRSLAADPKVRVIILRGAGRAFSAGADISQEAGRPPENAAVDRARLRSAIDTCFNIWDAPKPVIAQVHGYCFGFGVVVCTYCDLTLVAEDTVVGWPSVPIGAGLISPVASWLIGIRKAKEFSYLVGSRFTGREAVDLGWANRAYHADQLGHETLNLARRIARVPPDILRLKKEANNRVWESMGFRASAFAGAEFDAIAHSSNGMAEMRKLVNERGWKEAAKTFTE